MLRELALIGVDDDGQALRLLWSDAPGWLLQKETAPERWVDVASYSQTPPVKALPFAQWLPQGESVALGHHRRCSRGAA